MRGSPDGRGFAYWISLRNLVSCPVFDPGCSFEDTDYAVREVPAAGLVARWDEVAVTESDGIHVYRDCRTSGIPTRAARRSATACS
jgi:hypothetical protein